VTVGEREQMSGWDRRQAVMAVANMVESLLRGGGQAGRVNALCEVGPGGGQSAAS